MPIVYIPQPKCQTCLRSHRPFISATSTAISHLSAEGCHVSNTSQELLDEHLLWWRIVLISPRRFTSSERDHLRWCLFLCRSNHSWIFVWLRPTSLAPHFGHFLPRPRTCPGRPRWRRRSPGRRTSPPRANERSFRRVWGSMRSFTWNLLMIHSSWLVWWSTEWERFWLTLPKQYELGNWVNHFPLLKPLTRIGWGEIPKEVKPLVKPMNTFHTPNRRQRSKKNSKNKEASTQAGCLPLRKKKQSYLIGGSLWYLIALWGSQPQVANIQDGDSQEPPSCIRRVGCPACWAARLRRLWPSHRPQSQVTKKANDVTGMSN